MIINRSTPSSYWTEIIEHLYTDQILKTKVSKYLIKLW